MKVKFVGLGAELASAGPEGSEPKTFPFGKPVEVSTKMGGYLLARGDFEEVAGGKEKDEK